MLTDLALVIFPYLLNKFKNVANHLNYHIVVIMLGIFIFGVSNMVPSVFAMHNSHLFVSAENSKFQNYFVGPMIVEIVVSDPDISDTTTGKGEPDVTVNGNKLRMIQATNGNWHGYFADKDQAQIADETVRASGVAGHGLDFGVFCNSETSSVFGVSFNEASAIALPRSNGLNGYVEGTNVITNCTGSPDAGAKLNKVLREAPALNTNSNVLTGQIGINRDAWPLVQLYQFTAGGNVIVQYNRGGEVETTVLWFDTIPSNLSRLSLFHSLYQPEQQVKFSLTDVQLNIDPTDEDSWTFSTHNSFEAQTRYQLFDENGNADSVCVLGNPTCSSTSDYGPGSPDIVPAMLNLMFEDNGILRIIPNTQGPQVIGFRDNADEIFDVLNGNLSQPVTVVETTKNSGLFVNFDESNVANLFVLQNAPLGQSGTINYNDLSYSVVVGNQLYCGKTVDQFNSVIDKDDSNNVLAGTSGSDLIFGFGGDDRIWGRGGDDCIFGGEGNDYLVGGTGDDQINGDSGNDKIWGQAGLDVLFGSLGNDRLAGGDDNDSIFGEWDNDFLWGQTGDDILDGGTQIDVCSGGTGANTLTTCEISQ